MPNALVHLGFIRHFRSSERERYDTNVRGTKQLLDHCIHHGVQKVVVISSSYVYGAFPENPYFMDEDSPLSASRSYPGDPRSRRGRHARVGLPVALPAPAHVRAAARERARQLRALDDRAVPEAVADPDRDGLRPDDAVHPRGGSLRGDRARARAQPAGRVQRDGPGPGAAAHGDPRDGRPRVPGARADPARGVRSRVALGLPGDPARARSTISSTRSRSRATASSRPPTSAACSSSARSSRASRGERGQRRGSW